MRITVDLPADLHAKAVAVARDTNRTLSQTVADLIRRGLGQRQDAKVTTSTRTGLPVIHLGQTTTTDDVRKLDDEP